MIHHPAPPLLPALGPGVFCACPAAQPETSPRCSPPSCLLLTGPEQGRLRPCFSLGPGFHGCTLRRGCQPQGASPAWGRQLPEPAWAYTVSAPFGQHPPSPRQRQGQRGSRRRRGAGRKANLRCPPRGSAALGQGESRHPPGPAACAGPGQGEAGGATSATSALPAPGAGRRGGALKGPGQAPLSPALAA